MQTGKLISDAEVAEIDYTAFAAPPSRYTARLIVRRVRDRNHPDELFLVWGYHPSGGYHPFFTNNTEPVTARTPPSGYTRSSNRCSPT